MEDARKRHGRRPPRIQASTRQVVEAALAVIVQASRERPADRVLREMFRAARGLDAEARRWISGRVFAFYRWRRWCDAPNEKGLQHAWALQEAYRNGSLSVSPTELRQGAIPDWVKGAMKCPPAWLEALQRVPRVWLRARRGREKAVQASLSCCNASWPAHPQCLEYLGEEDLYRTPAFQKGDFEMQDAASQAVGWICAPEAGQNWWDACAGAGGKTLLLSDLMDNRGLIWATDRSTRRLQELKRRAARAGVFNYRTSSWVRLNEIPVRSRFDGVLVDAPCTGLGTWQRNPHARWTVTPEDVSQLAELQFQLLRQAASRVKEGGRLVYSVCTLTNQETRGVTDRFTKVVTGFVPEPISSPWPGGESEGGQKGLLLWPDATGGDGMYVAVWRRTREATA